jgi:hypothetical protein
MKTIRFLLFLTFLVTFAYNAGAQDKLPPPRQAELLKQFVGEWKCVYTKDTAEYWDAQEFGKTIFITVYSEIKGVREAIYINSFGIDYRFNEINGYMLNSNSTYFTWTGYWVNEKSLKIDIVDNFKRGSAFMSSDYVFVSADEIDLSMKDPKGQLLGVRKFYRIK